MSFDDILRRINEDAGAEASRILEEAEYRACEIREEAESEAEEESRKALLRAESEAEEEKRRILALERLEARRDLLMARQNAVDDVYDEVIERLARLPDADYLRLVRKTVLEAVETGEETVLISPGDRDRITPGFLRELNSELAKRGLRGSLGIETAERELGGGVLLQGEGTEVNCAFPQLLKSVKEEMEPQVIKALFPREETRG